MASITINLFKYQSPWSLNHGRSLVSHGPGEIQRVDCLVGFYQTGGRLHEYENSGAANASAEISGDHVLMLLCYVECGDTRRGRPVAQ